MTVNKVSMVPRYIHLKRCEKVFANGKSEIYEKMALNASHIVDIAPLSGENLGAIFTTIVGDKIYYPPKQEIRCGCPEYRSILAAVLYDEQGFTYEG